MVWAPHLYFASCEVAILSAFSAHLDDVTFDAVQYSSPPRAVQFLAQFSAISDVMDRARLANALALSLVGKQRRFSKPAGRAACATRSAHFCVFAPVHCAPGYVSFISLPYCAELPRVSASKPEKDSSGLLRPLVRDRLCFCRQ